MKYIRTEGDKIIGYDENSSELDKPMILYYPNKIVKEADTIKELCDCFIDHDLEYDTFLITQDSTYRHNHEIYGMIRAHKVIKCVARINEKGEWELL